MISTRHVQLLAQYNQWMNEKVYAAAGALSPEQLTQDKGAFRKDGQDVGVTDLLMLIPDAGDTL